MRIDPEKEPHYLRHLGSLEAGRYLSTVATQLPAGSLAYCYEDDPECKDGVPVPMMDEMQAFGWVQGDPEYWTARDKKHQRWLITDAGSRFLADRLGDS